MPDPRFLQHFAPSNPFAGAGILLPSDLGFAAWSDPPQNAVSSGAGPAAAGTLALRRFSIPGAMVVSNFHIQIGTGGTLTASQCFAGVWDGNGQLVALSADLSGVLNGTGLLTIPLTGDRGVDTPFIYAGYWYNGGVAPFPARIVPVDTGMMNGLASVLATSARAVTANTGLTTVATAPAQLSSITKSGTTNGAFWCAVS